MDYRTYATVLEEPQVHRPFALCFKKQNSVSNCHLKFYCDYPSCAEMEGKSSASVTELLQLPFSQCNKVVGRHLLSDVIVLTKESTIAPSFTLPPSV